MFGIVLIIIGIVLLIRKKVTLTKNITLVGKDAVHLGWFCLIYGLAPILIPATPLVKKLTENTIFAVVYIAVPFIVIYWFAKNRNHG